MRKHVILCFFVFLLVIPILSDFKQVELDAEPVDEIYMSYVDHPNITIVGNDDFSSYFSGLGTAEQPYLLEDKNITSSDTLISITDTDAYCVIKNCFFRTAKDVILPADAIVLDNASHVTIESCIFYNVSSSVDATGSANLTIIDSFSDDIRPSSIYLDDCPYANLTGNTVQGSFWTGNPTIKLASCNYSRIIDNNVTWGSIQIISSTETNAIDNILFRSKLFIYESAGVVAEYNTFDGDDGKDCIQILSCSQCNISHNIVANQQVNGIEVSESAEVVLQNNTVYSATGRSNNDYGILIEDSLDCTVQNNTVSNNLDRAGIGILSSNNTILRDNIAFYNNYGYYDRGTLDTKFNNCIAYDNSDDGYNIWQSNRTELEYCNSSSNEEDGFYIHECYECQVSFCFSEFNEYSGFSFSFDNDTLIWECRAYDNGQTYGYEGYEMTYSNHTQIWWTSAEGNSGGEFYFRECYYGLVNLSGISEAGSIGLSSCMFFELDNLELYRSGSIGMVDVTNVTVSDSSFDLLRGTAIHVESSVNVSIVRNEISDHRPGSPTIEAIYVEDSSAIMIKDNKISNIEESAIYLDSSTNCYLHNNTLDFRGLYVKGTSRSHWAHEITMDNTVDGKPIYYLVNESFADYDVTPAGQVFLVDCENVSTTGGSIVNTSVGYVIVYSNNCSVSSLLTDGCVKGLISYYSEDCRVTSSYFYNGGYSSTGVLCEYSTSMNITDCYAEWYGSGFNLKYSNKSILDSNEAHNITHDGIIIADSYDCIVTNNTMSTMWDNAIYASWSDNIRLEDNIMIDDIDDGIYLSRCQDFIIIDNEIVAKDTGIPLSQSTGIIDSNTVQGNFACLWLSSSQDLEIYNNTFSSTGIFINNNDMAYYNHTMNDNSVGGLPIGYFKGQDNLQIDASNYGQLFLLYCENSTVQGSAMTKVSVPLYLASCYNITVANYSLNEVHWGLKSYNSTHCSIENHTVSGSTNAGVRLSQSHNTSLSYVNISMSEYYGIYLYQCEDSVLLNSEVWNCTQGVYAQNSHNLQIYGLKVINCTSYGVNLYFSDNVVTNDSLVIGCLHGLYLYGADNCNVTNSGFFNNTEDGVWVRSGSNNLFYLNEFGGNSDNNARDDVAGNLWDDDIQYGNYWSDYSGGGIYEVPGTGGGIDGFPNGLPGYTIVISSPDNQTFNEGSTGKSIVWTSSSSYIRSYQVYMNSSVQCGGSWTGGPIIISLNGLTNGTYYYTLVLTSFFGSSNSDVVEIIVVPITTPTIDGPEDLWYWVGDEGNNVTLNCYSSDPDYSEFYINGTLNGPYNWDGTDMEGSLDGFDVGLYNITTVVYSRCGNSASYTFMLTVRARSIPQIDSPDDFWYWFDSDGNDVIWNVSCTYPDSYDFFVNESLEESGTWDGTNIVIDVNGYSVGVHNLTLVLYSQSDNSTSDTVILIVKALSKPEINQPDDILFVEGTEGESITWIVSDTYPDSYELVLDGLANDSGDWDGSDIIVLLDGLDAGTYNFTLIVYSECGLYSSDSVIVTVTSSETTPTDTTTTTTTTTNTTTGTTSGTPTIPDVDLGPIILAVGAGGCIIAVVIAMMFLRKRQSG